MRWVHERWRGIPGSDPLHRGQPHELALGPAVADACHVPVDDVGRGVPVELVADIDELLHRGDVDVVDGAEVQDDGLECRTLIRLSLLKFPWLRIIPWAILT